MPFSDLLMAVVAKMGILTLLRAVTNQIAESRVLIMVQKALRALNLVQSPVAAILRALNLVQSPVSDMLE